MLRSILNSVSGRSSVGKSGAGVIIADRGATPFRYEDWTPRRPAAVNPTTEQPSEQPAALRPERCCVHCGHSLYVPPRQLRVRCPKCLAELSARDVTLEGEVTDTQIVTAGKITVMPGARVAAELIACRVDIGGMVLGNVLASQQCQVRSTGKLAGTILCRQLNVEAGAEISGAVELIQS